MSIALNDLQLDTQTLDQIKKCQDLAMTVLGKDFISMYLYGSTVAGGPGKYSDLDLFIVASRPTTHNEKSSLVKNLLSISGIYMKEEKRPIELTIVEKAALNPWHYPPHFDFQYGEWLREEFKLNNINVWSTKEMPDLAILVPQLLGANSTIYGPDANQVLTPVPYKDFVKALASGTSELMDNLKSDTRNVLLTLARTWCTMSTDTIRSKVDAANWALSRLPDRLAPVIQRAQEIYKGEVSENWSDMQESIKPCAAFMHTQVMKLINAALSSNITHKKITLA